MKNIYILIILFFSTLNSFSQIKNEYNQPKNKYMRYLLVPDSNTHTGFFNFNYSYLYMPNNNSFRTNGTHLNLGINIARFFTKKIILGVCLDFKILGSLSKQHFSSEFKNDFNLNFKQSYDNENDSLHGFALKSIINQNDKTCANSNKFENIGIEFSPFPHKYGGVVIQVKSGFREFRTSAYGYNLSTTDDGNIYLVMHKCLSFNLMFNPYLFFNKKNVDFINTKPKDFFKFIIVSLYFEKLNLNNAAFGGVPLEKIVNQDFINKYSNIYNFGFKVGFGLY